MSKIVEKAFDASKKIIRSIFNGSPNLITTSDLNRQFEALKYQVDKLDEKTGFLIEGANLSFKLEGSTLKVELIYDTIEYKGCTFNPEERTIVETNFTAAAPYAYLCLVADKETITYDMDVTHEIAGAKFVDGTSMGAADQVVYKNERFVLTHSVASLGNLVGIIAFFRLIAGRVYVNENWTDFYSPLRVKDGSESIGGGFATSLKYPIKLGDTYNNAFGKIQGFLGDSTVFRGGWGYLHQSYSEISTEDYEGMLRKSPAELIKFGPIYYVRLLGLTPFEGIDKEDYALSNLKWLLMGRSMDAAGIVVFRNLPEAYKIGKFMGVSVGIPPLMKISNVVDGEVREQQYISSINVNSAYVGNINSQELTNSFGFSLSTFGNYDESKFNFDTGVVSSAGDGMAITLMFTDKDIW